MAALVVAEQNRVEDRSEYLVQARIEIDGSGGIVVSDSKEISDRSSEAGDVGSQVRDLVEDTSEEIVEDRETSGIRGVFGGAVMNVGKHDEGKNSSEVVKVRESGSRWDEKDIGAGFVGGRSELLKEGIEEVRDRACQHEFDESFAGGIFFVDGGVRRGGGADVEVGGEEVAVHKSETVSGERGGGDLGVGRNFDESTILIYMVKDETEDWNEVREDVDDELVREIFFARGGLFERVFEFFRRFGDLRFGVLDVLREGGDLGSASVEGRHCNVGGVEMG